MPSKKNRRNFHACHPIMKKGGVHEKSKGAKRAAAKHETRRKTRECLGTIYGSIFDLVVFLFLSYYHNKSF